MKPIERGEILGLAAYEQVREPFRTRVMAMKKRRRVQLGPRATVVFENRDTVLLQIQEMLRTERITRPGAVQQTAVLMYGQAAPETSTPAPAPAPPPSTVAQRASSARAQPTASPTC